MLVVRTFKQIWSILNNHQRVRIIELSALMIVGGFMEMLSVTMILPFISAIMDPEEVRKHTEELLADY